MKQSFRSIKMLFYTEEDAYDVLDRLRDDPSYMKNGYVTVWKLWRLADLPTNYVMRSWGWYDLEGATVERDNKFWLLTMPPAELIEEDEEMKKQTMNLKNSLCSTSTSTATVNWHDNTYTLTNPSVTFEQYSGCQSDITISGDTIGVANWALNNTDYTSYFRNTRGYCEENIKKMEDKMNGVAKRNGKTIDAAMKFEKIEVYNDRVVKITFTDGTYTKAVCSEADDFCLDTGIIICVMKKLLGGQKEGTKIFNNMIDKAHAQMEKQENDKIEAENKRIAEKNKKRRTEMNRKAKKLKAKEEAIDIQKQAYIRAMQEMEMAKNE